MRTSFCLLTNFIWILSENIKFFRDLYIYIYIFIWIIILNSKSKKLTHYLNLLKFKP